MDESAHARQIWNEILRWRRAAALTWSLPAGLCVALPAISTPLGGKFNRSLFYCLYSSTVWASAQAVVTFMLSTTSRPAPVGLRTTFSRRSKNPSRQALGGLIEISHRMLASISIVAMAALDFVLLMPDELPVGGWKMHIAGGTLLGVLFAASWFSKRLFILSIPVAPRPRYFETKSRVVPMLRQALTLALQTTALHTGAIVTAAVRPVHSLTEGGESIVHPPMAVSSALSNYQALAVFFSHLSVSMALYSAAEMVHVIMPEHVAFKSAPSGHSGGNATMSLLINSMGSADTSSFPPPLAVPPPLIRHLAFRDASETLGNVRAAAIFADDTGALWKRTLGAAISPLDEAVQSLQGVTSGNASACNLAHDTIAARKTLMRYGIDAATNLVVRSRGEDTLGMSHIYSPTVTDVLTLFLAAHSEIRSRVTQAWREEKQQMESSVLEEEAKKAGTRQMEGSCNEIAHALESGILLISRTMGENDARKMVSSAGSSPLGVKALDVTFETLVFGAKSGDKRKE